MPKTLSEDLREAAAVAILALAKKQYPDYTDAQLSSALRRASAKIRKIRGANKAAPAPAPASA